MTPNHIGTTSTSGTMDLSDPHPDISTLDWHAGWDMSQYLYWYLVASENASLFPEVSESPLPSPSPVAELYSTFSSGALQDTSSQAAGQDGLPPLPDVPEPSSSQPRTTAMPFDNDTRDGRGYYDEGTGMRVRVTGTQSPVEVPIKPPPARSLPLAATIPFNWIKVPQRDYDHGRKQWGFKRLESVSFNVNGRPGINLGDALRKKFEGLDGRDDPVLQDASGAISCRFLFPGYPTNGRSYQINTLDWTRKRQPITRCKLAYEVARRLERYLFDMAGFALDGLVEKRWMIGQGFMRIDSMFLVRLVSVSKGSFQPEICVVDPSLPDPSLV